MKKILALIIALLMLLSFAACSKSNQGTTVGNQNKDDELVLDDEMVYENLTYGINADNGLFEITGYIRTGTDQIDIVIPDEIDGRDVVGIADGAFIATSAYIKSVTLPSTITYIGAHAFYGCKYITSVTLPASVTEIRNGAFEDCIALETVTMSEKLVTIGNGAFKNCEALKEITLPETLTTIGDASFWGCKEITEVSIPESVTAIGDAAFFECDTLAKVTVTDKLVEIGAIAFNSCDENLVITAPADSAFAKYAVENEYTLAEPTTSAE